MMPNSKRSALALDLSVSYGSTLNQNYHALHGRSRLGIAVLLPRSKLLRWLVSVCTDVQLSDAILDMVLPVSFCSVRRRLRGREGHEDRLQSRPAVQAVRAADGRLPCR